MKDFESLAHVRWECKYHVIFIPKYRRKVIYGKLRAADRWNPAGFVQAERDRVVGRTCDE